MSDDGNLPLAFLLLGAGAVLAFLAMRPWPQTSGGAVQPGAYVVDILKGTPPPAGPSNRPSNTEVEWTEAGLVTLLTFWALGKMGGWLKGIAPGGNSAGGGEDDPDDSDTGGAGDVVGDLGTDLEDFPVG
jgi:hypothetical protein